MSTPGILNYNVEQLGNVKSRNCVKLTAIKDCCCTTSLLSSLLLEVITDCCCADSAPLEPPLRDERACDDIPADVGGHAE